MPKDFLSLSTLAIKHNIVFDILSYQIPAKSKDQASNPNPNLKLR